MEITPEIKKKLELLEEKFSSSGQDLVAYLDGLLYADYLTYWDYIHLDTLLSLQSPLTKFPDEEIFIMYHQITELYFKLSLHEFKQLSIDTNISSAYLLERIKRINNYFEALIASFTIMIDGMNKEQFLKFRMSLLPASGFQSAQYRMIEICATDFYNLIDKDYRNNFKSDYSSNKLDEMFEFIYWKKGATELATGNKTLTLLQFENKYSDELKSLMHQFYSKNFWRLFSNLPTSEKSNTDLINQLRLLDVNVNVNWPLSHYKSAVRYLERNPEDIAATGGTNWQKYLPPRFQKRIFYPDLWTEKEIEDWGKGWVKKEVFGVK
jgi:tryptophan 2,3-dioxygenase